MDNVSIIILVVILLYELYRHIKFKKVIKKIISELDDILAGNTSRRFFSEEQSTDIRNLIYKLNKHMEEFQAILQENKQVEEKRKKMISDISHDIRTPLTSIQGFMEALQNDDGLSDEEKYEYINIVVTKCHMLNDLVQSFFELSRLDEEDMAIPLEKTDINACVRTAMACFYNDFERESIIPEIILPEYPVFVYANSVSIERVLQNLISNTLYYGKEGHSFGIKVEKKGNQVWTYLWDKGKGIPKEEIPYVFERTYKTRSAVMGKPIISGLGLAIVKKLIEKHHGEITVSSLPEDKTVFSFYLESYDNKSDINDELLRSSSMEG